MWWTQKTVLAFPLARVLLSGSCLSGHRVFRSRKRALFCLTLFKTFHCWSNAFTLCNAGHPLARPPPVSFPIPFPGFPPHVPIPGHTLDPEQHAALLNMRARAGHPPYSSAAVALAHRTQTPGFDLHGQMRASGMLPGIMPTGSAKEYVELGNKCVVSK